MSDSIKTLPIDKEPASVEDYQLAKLLSNKKHKLMLNIKEGLLVALIVLILSIPIIDSILNKLPFIGSPYILSLTKAIIALILFIAVKTFYLK